MGMAGEGEMDGCRMKADLLFPVGGIMGEEDLEVVGVDAPEGFVEIA